MICLTLIARNEARCLARCLDSAAPFVDEMLVVDTGSTDDTREIALACGARVAEIAWRNDFSAARNFSLAQTGAEWRLVLDADEWIQGGGECLRQVRDGDGQSYVGQVRILEAFEGGAAVRLPPLWISRLLPRGVEFEGRIHEQVVHRLAVRRLPLTIGHDGYQRARLEGKADRNERLLRMALRETPDNPYLRYQLGRQLEIRGQHADACLQYRSARTLLHWPPANAADARAMQERYAWLHDLVVRHLYSMKRARAFEAAVLQSQDDSAWWQHSPDFHFTVGDLLLDFALAEPQRASQLMPLIQASWMRCLELGETPALDGAIAGRGSYLAAHNLAVLHGLLGDAARAAHFRSLADHGRSAAQGSDT
jgi:glycosyltransferase involved in cell wall biosynthesis